MSAATQFKPGLDPRRSRNTPGRDQGGRPPNPATIRRKILRAVGPDLDDLLSRLRTLAKAGDPEATCALASLLAAALAGSTRSGAE
jgi:ABC-type transporter Mla subunit MlaD